MDGKVVLVWRDLSGDPGEMYEFICEVATLASVSHTFELVGMPLPYLSIVYLSFYLHFRRLIKPFSLPMHVGTKISTAPRPGDGSGLGRIQLCVIPILTRDL